MSLEIEVSNERNHMADSKDIRPFSEFLAEQRNGVLAMELSEGLNKLVESVETTGKPGYMNLKISVKQMKDTQGAVLVTDLVTVKAPESHPEFFFFVDGDSNLTRRNERQLGLTDGLLEVPERLGNNNPKEVR